MNTIFGQIFQFVFLALTLFMAMSCTAGMVLKKHTTRRRFFEFLLMVLFCTLFVLQTFGFLLESGPVQFTGVWMDENFLAESPNSEKGPTHVLNESIFIGPFLALLIGAFFGSFANRTGYVPPSMRTPSASSH
jgi:hypothetical protein